MEKNVQAAMQPRESRLLKLNSKLEAIWENWQEDTWQDTPHPDQCLMGMLNWHNTGLVAEFVPVTQMREAILRKYDRKTIVIMGPEEEPGRCAMYEEFVYSHNELAKFVEHAIEYFHYSSDEYGFIIVALK